MERLWHYARLHKRQTTWGILMLLCTNLCAQLIPQLTRWAIDAIESGDSYIVLREIAGLLALTALGSCCFRALSRVHIFFAAREVEMRLRSDYFKHIATMDPQFFQEHSIGDLMSRATNDLGQLRLLLGPGILNIVNTTLAYAVAIPLMWVISSKLTLAILTTYLPALLLMRYLAKLLYLRNREQQAKMGDLSAFVQESLAGAHVIRAFALDESKAERFKTFNQASYEAGVHLAWLRSGMFRIVMSLSALTTLIAVYVGAQEVVNGQLRLGDVVAIIEYMALLTWPTFALGWVLSMWQRGHAAMNRLNAIFDRQPEISSVGDFLEQVEPSISIRELTVELGGVEVLNGLSVELREGQTLGIVGTIGSGKSTFLKALMRFVPIKENMIFYGGHDVVRCETRSLRAQFGYVPQENILFSKSLLENVAFGRPSVPQDKIEEALKMAAFDYDDGTLPEGLLTPVGERGISLSGGQKQRLSMARAMLLDPPVLILDDSLSAVDSETEERILRNLRDIRKGKTTIIATHRISAVSGADEILVLNEGKVIERGTHVELLRIDGLYASMLRKQELTASLAS
ncbi:MAG: ABC transporter ATP-binding protein [Myxococcota bacterium]|nr:ABC transporter ATP-binding protein [Myxococcota bacterium]